MGPFFYLSMTCMIIKGFWKFFRQLVTETPEKFSKQIEKKKSDKVKILGIENEYLIYM